MSDDAMVAVNHDDLETYDSREKYVRDRTGGSLQEGKERLCNVLVDHNGPVQADIPRIGFPWLSPVLGSGATGDLDGAGQVARSAEQAVGTLSQPIDREIAAELATVLISQRLPGLQGSIDVSCHDTGASEPDLTALLLLAVSWLTRSYHRFRSLEASVLGRGGADIARLPNTPPRSEDITTFVEPTKSALTRVQAACEPDSDDPEPVRRIKEKARKVVNRAIDGLEPGGGKSFEIQQIHVTALTELCWYSMSGSLYPGWSDLLWGLFLNTTKWPPSQQRGPRPLLWSMDNAVAAIREKYAERTKRSWEELDSTEQERVLLHDAVSEALVAQASYREHWRESKALLPPVAVAYVTTFDLELEMALLRHEQDFVMAMPVNVIAKRTVRGETAWLRGIVWAGCWVKARPSPDLQKILEPPSNSWFLLSNKKSYETTPQSFSPTIVRLAGSPLVRCPRFSEAPTLKDEIDALLPGEPEDELSHALLLDEYVALDHFAAMLSRVESKDKEKAREYELPRGISAANLGAGYSRFWMMIGVQFGDAAIRQSIGVQLALPRSKVTSKVPKPRRNGVAIQGQQPVSGEVEDLLHRIGLDVVTTDFALFLQDIRHYSKHLDAAISRLPVSSEIKDLQSPDPKKRQQPNLAKLPATPTETCQL